MTKFHHVRRGVVAFSCALLLALAGSISSSSTATAATSNGSPVGDRSWLTVATVTPYALCRSVRHDFSGFVSWGEKRAQVAAGTSQQSFNLRTEVTNPAGKITDVEIASFSSLAGEPSPRAPRSFVLCAGPGWYTANVTGWWCPGAQATNGSSPACVDVAFSKRFLLKAINNNVTLKRDGGSSRVRGSKARYVVIATTRHRGTTKNLRGVRVSLQRKVGSRWHTAKTGLTNSRGRLAIKVKYSYAGKQTYRAALRSSKAVSSATSKSRTTRVTVPRPKKVKHTSTSSPDYSGGGSSSEYNGPRCYAPGGKTWRPC